MDILALFNINNTLVNIPIDDGYALSWIEAVGTVAGLLNIWLASQEKAINYLFGLINVTLFGIIFFQIQLYGLLMLQIFFFAANVYGWIAWTRPEAETGDLLKVRWLPRQKLLMTAAASTAAIAILTPTITIAFTTLASAAVAVMNLFGANLVMAPLEPGAYPFWDASITVLSVVAQILMTRKYVENWILWVVINMISIGVYAVQGVYALSLQYAILLFIAVNGVREWQLSASKNIEGFSVRQSC